MNFLAHSLLAGTDDPRFLAGNLVADLVKGASALASYPPRIQSGILYHRLVDRETDRHPVFVRSRSRIRPPFVRFAGALTDIFYDHVLITEWDRWASMPFPEHSRRVADCLRATQEYLPEGFRPIADRIESGVFFARYATHEGVGVSLQRVAARFARPTPIAEAVTELERLDGELREDFAEFWPALRAILPEPAEWAR